MTFLKACATRPHKEAEQKVTYFYEYRSIPMDLVRCDFTMTVNRYAPTHTALSAKLEVLQPETPPALLRKKPCDNHIHIIPRALKLRKINSENVNWITNS